MLKISSTLLIIILLFSCGENKSKSERVSSPRVKKETKIISPEQNQKLIRGSNIKVEISSSEENKIDSIIVSLGNEEIVFKQTTFEMTFPTRKVGSWKLKSQVFFGGKSETHYTKVIVLPENAPEQLTYEVVNSYPHDMGDYTQGLLINDGFLYESTGQEGESAFKKKNLKTGESLQAVNLSDDLFGEGLALLNEEFYQITWKAGQGFVYNMNMEQIRTFTYQTEGWGLTDYNDQLIMTTSKETIAFIEPKSFTILDQIEVYDNIGKVDSLNELEVIDGLIYANVYLEDYVVVVDPRTGEVLKKIDFSGLLSKSEKINTDVLNGIAYDQATGRIFVTGKYWPKLFEVKLISKKSQL